MRAMAVYAAALSDVATMSEIRSHSWFENRERRANVYNADDELRVLEERMESVCYVAIWGDIDV